MIFVQWPAYIAVSIYVSHVMIGGSKFWQFWQNLLIHNIK